MSKTITDNDSKVAEALLVLANKKALLDVQYKHLADIVSMNIISSAMNDKTFYTDEKASELEKRASFLGDKLNQSMDLIKFMMDIA